MRSTDHTAFRSEVAAFLEEWNSDTDTLQIHTSGSTGKPKEVRAEKKRMIASARMTVDFLGLKPGDTALLCMPVRYIAGKMVIVRSVVAGLKLIAVTPSGHPLSDVDSAPDFAAMIPMQVFNSLHVAEERRKLMQIRQLIIGGGAIDEKMARELKRFPNAVWSTYGMTETLSHIALRRLSGPDASDWYTPMEGVDVSLSEEGTLVIHAPSVNPEILVTNDLAEFNGSGQFRILGRRDNTINTGGIKVQIEDVEQRLKETISTPLAVTSVPDEKLGERIVLLLQEPLPETENLSRAIDSLPVYWRPKQILSVNEIPMTPTGKPDRARARSAARNAR